MFCGAVRGAIGTYSIHSSTLVISNANPDVTTTDSLLEKWHVTPSINWGKTTINMKNWLVQHYGISEHEIIKSLIPKTWHFKIRLAISLSTISKAKQINLPPQFSPVFKDQEHYMNICIHFLTFLTCVVIIVSWTNLLYRLWILVSGIHMTCNKFFS